VSKVARGVSIWQQALLTSWNQVWTSFLAILPTILGAIVVFAIGLILAYWAKRLTTEVLKFLKVQKLSSFLGLDQFLKKAELKVSFNEFLGALVQWMIILIFFMATVDILGLSSVSVVLTQVLSYIPNILAATLIFAAGYYVARLTENLVRSALVSVDHDIAKPVSKLARFFLILVSFFAALDQLKIARGLISTFFQGLTYTIVLAVGLSVGLGAKDLISKVLNDWYQKIKK